MTALPTRRSALALLAAAGAASLARPAPAAAQLLSPPGGPLPVPGFGGGASGGALDGLRISRVAVDVRALTGPYFSPLADTLARDLSADLRAIFADRMAGPGDRGVSLLGRVDSLRLRPWAGGRAGGSGNDGADNIEGAGLVLSGGRVLSETPIYTALQPSYSGQWYDPDIDRRRVASISYQFAYWLRRNMGL